MPPKLAQRRKHRLKKFAAYAVKGHIHSFASRDLLHGFLQIRLACVDVTQQIDPSEASCLKRLAVDGNHFRVLRMTELQYR